MLKTTATLSICLLLIAILATITSQAQQTKATVSKQPVLGHRTVTLLTINNLQFKDLNRNGQLDRYEDWRLAPAARAKDLVSKMSVEQKVGFMLISTTRLKNDWSFEAPKNTEPITADFNETDLIQTINMFSKQPLPIAIMSAAGTTKAVTQYHLRHFILRVNTATKTIAAWSNNLQALCESEALGIPAIVASNPRNHITRDASIGLSVGKTTFSAWPGELGLSATRDLKLVRNFANIARQEWAAVGLRKGYMYMADLSTEPRWQRVEGTFGEDAHWVAKMTTEIVLGFQGNKLSNTSVALTTKHFPGGGATEGGQDPHFNWGKNEVFPGGMFNNNLIPFKAAIKAGTSSIMPYYSIPNNTQYEKVAYAYNKEVLQNLLRKQLDFKGIINSDTGPIEMMPWGAENLSIKERYKKTLEAGVNIYSGSADPAPLLETVKSGMVNMALIDHSVTLLLIEKFELGLFENPYVDEDAAEKLVGNKNFQQQAAIAFRKSIVLLRNQEHALPLKPNTKIYFEAYVQKKGVNAGTVYTPSNNNYPIEFVQTSEEADVIVVWVTPGAKSLFDADGSPLYLSLSKNGVDTAYINKLTAKKPTVLLINYTNPWVINEIYNEKRKGTIKAVLATFGTTADAVLDVLTGTFNPTGKMPFTTPVSEAAAQNQLSDVPGYLKGPGYALFKYNEGLSYK
ncbi:MAG: glycoside hydrolase family 3 protein [Sphingobacteriales bacterium]|nr:MAG: glycoside hydrolase family 3 protein [Sphingobacteriales bacterium]